MSLRPLAIFPDPVLRRMPEDVVDFGEDLALLVSDLWESMEAYDGVGLAAPQIGASLRVAVVRLG
ncbi:MAG TPA: peptide deformylase, partial [Synergistaceae bacterium]|nr:peptide deformylase [Synergistaceae bacterium]